MKVYQFRLTGDLYLVRFGKKKIQIICGQNIEWFVRFNDELLFKYSDLIGDL